MERNRSLYDKARVAGLNTVQKYYTWQRVRMGTAQEWSESEIAFAFFREFGFIKGTQLTFEDRLSKSRNQVDTLIKIETAIGLMRDVTGFLMILGGVNAAFYAKGGPYEKKD